jgi:transcriptional regulator with XRE-family HTH domain
MQKTLTHDELVALLRKKQGKRTQGEFSQELGCTQSHLSEIYSGIRKPNDQILELLGLEIDRIYRRTS